MTLSPASSGVRRRAAIAAAFALVAGLLTFSAPLSASADVIGTGPGSISGTVTAADGSAQVGLYVSASSNSTYGSTITDATGHFELTGLALNESVYIYVSHPQGYQQAPARYVTLTDASPASQQNYVLTPYATGVGTVSGHITADGVALAGQHVSANQFSTGQNESSVTDENGYYAITGLPDGEWQVYAYAGSQYQTVQSPVVFITGSAPTATANIAFVSYPTGTSTISGVVTDSATGEPVAGVNVALSSPDAAQNSALTNAAGTFTFDLLPAGTFTIWYNANGYLWFQEDIMVASNQTVLANRSLVAKNATVSGRLQLADGTPVAGQFVQAQAVDSMNYGGAESDENGNFVISNLGAVAYTLSIGGFSTPYNIQERRVVAVANGNVSANFTLVPRTTGSLSGYVNQPDGNAYLKPVCATLYSSKTKKAVAEQYIDGEHYGSDEFYFANLKPGKYTVEIRDCDNDPATKFDKVFLGGVKNIKNATFVTIVAAVDSWGYGIEFAPRK